jgi:hypothetical protein
VREIVVHLPRVDRTASANETQHRLHALPLRGGPGRGARARMHERVEIARHEPVVDEDVLLDAKRGVASLQVAGSVPLDSMSQYEVLSAGRCPNRIRLDEAARVQGSVERGGWE